MRPVRRLLAQRHLAALICAAALLLRLLVPAGHMVATTHGDLAIILCPGTVPAATTTGMPGMHDHLADHGGGGDHGGGEDHGGAPDHAKAQMPCVFAGLSAAALGAIDPILLAALIAFILAHGLIATIPPAPSSPAYLRPPLRGPPTYL